MADDLAACRHHRVLIVGGGTAGITVAAVLLRQHPGLDVALLEPSGDHWYQPGWTLVGAGLMDLADTRRDEAGLIPPGCHWIRAAASGFDPAANAVHTERGETITYDALVVAVGIRLLWERIEGLPEALGNCGIVSNYSGPHVPGTWKAIQAFRGGTAIFTVPETPIKCGGVPQKVMVLADDVFNSKSGVGVNSRVIFATAGGGIFGVPAFARVLRTVIQRRGIEVRLRHRLIAVRPDEQMAVFEVTGEDGLTRTEAIGFDLLHVVPPMAAPEVVATSSLAGDDPGGWVDVDPFTTRHRRFANVFALGDASSLPTARTAAAARVAAPVTAANLLALLDGRPLTARYDGYSVCPIPTGYGNVVMAEFAYGGRPVSSFLVDPTKERWSMWLLKPLAPLVRWLRLDVRAHPGDDASPAGEGCG